MQDYCKERYKWTDEVFDSVYWKAVKSVRSRLPHNKFRQTSKLMHGWLPVMHMRQYITGMNQCPCCTECKDETIKHLFQCPNHLMTQRRDEAIEQLRKKGVKGPPLPSEKINEESIIFLGVPSGKVSSHSTVNPGATIFTTNLTNSFIVISVPDPRFTKSWLEFLSNNSASFNFPITFS